MIDFMFFPHQQETCNEHEKCKSLRATRMKKESKTEQYETKSTLAPFHKPGNSLFPSNISPVCNFNFD